MGHLLRSSGGEVLIGIGSIAIGFLAIGLALQAQPELGVWPYRIAYAIAACIAVLFFVALFYLVKYAQKRAYWIRTLRELISEGKGIQNEIEASHVVDVNEWWDKSWDWLAQNLPDYIPDFGLDKGNYSLRFSGLNNEGSRQMVFMGSYLTNLLDILKDVRTSQ